MEKKLIIKLKPDGTVSSEALGFKGNGCIKATEWLDNLMGKPNRSVKSSFYQEPDLEEKNIIQGLPGGGEYCG